MRIWVLNHVSRSGQLVQTLSVRVSPPFDTFFLSEGLAASMILRDVVRPRTTARLHKQEVKQPKRAASRVGHL